MSWAMKLLGAYTKDGFERKLERVFPEGGPIIHFNDGIVVGEELWLSHSNYPGVLMISSAEKFALPSLGSLQNQSFGTTDGSLTGIAPAPGDQGKWFACFAHYSNRAAMPDRDSR